MAFIENGKYQSSAAMGASCQELASGLLLDKTGITIIKTGKIIFWSDLSGENGKWVKGLTTSQQNAINHYKAKYLLSSELYFIVLSTGEENKNPVTGEFEPTQYTLNGNIAQKILEAYNKHRYIDPKNPVELNENTEDSHYSNFEFLNNFVHNYLEGRKLEIPHPLSPNIQISIKVDRVYLFSIPSTLTKAMYMTRRGKRSKNRGKKK